MGFLLFAAITVCLVLAFLRFDVTEPEMPAHPKRQRRAPHHHH